MASFFITNQTTTAQTLLTGEAGFVATNAAIYRETGAAIIMNGISHLTVLGDVVSATGSAMTLNAVASPRIIIGAQGQVIGTGSSSRGINGSFGNDAFLQNAGLIAGAEAISLPSTSGTARLSLINSDRIEAHGGSGLDAVGLSLAVGGLANITNTGEMIAVAGILSLGAGNVVVTNIGVISTSNVNVNANAIDVTGGLKMTNAGTIHGAIDVTGQGAITNSGTIAGNIVPGNQNDGITNRGSIVGDVKLGNGANIFRNLGETVSGSVLGGINNDSYVIDRSDIRIFDSSGGADTVTSTASCQLNSGPETLILQGVVGLVGIGNEGGNTISGSFGDDTLRGLEGADFIESGDGDNRVWRCRK